MTLISDIIYENQKNILPIKYDLFICASGFEDRTIAGLERVSKQDTFTKSIINLYKIDENELMDRNLMHLGRIKDILSRISSNIDVVESQPNDSTRFFETLDDELKGKKNVLIDITSFTRLFLYSIMTSCMKNNVCTYVLYSEPENYTMNFSQGLEEIIILPTNPGVPDQSKKILMVMFLGWESKRLESVIEEWSPDKIITIAEYSDDKQRDYWNKITFQQCSKLVDRSESYEIPALNPKSALNKLEQIYSKYKDEYDICVLNIGPKINCLAITEFAFNHEEIQVIYPKPYKWKQEMDSTEQTHPISTGIGRTFLFEFPIN